ncbi:hypothetical protein FVEG_10180 [Fusarium verticillioides 7600]|uniref:Uncharacterized protein n=1 Tax=Gibberella moniliformis (strain M3125 / FGSC 7600) TaxID=334819 RepID=W7N2Y2_GIBM7|nr:hypothetical protein FVEG_10180 [Fusarium verticillioides 7600]XP_018757272.1 hypothetical protein FVEG_10180 [Fusarium verticillioides 7600]XP_018757273.1 hypothetical protein FVEG_10180 [Fusarium verticillioides 7600]EWG51080.1 hypothetical protein FVEG_10180 [Fusarium verticillioides 7600]EWG51081.1 hypothetical protein FVEG_10180 [Fusarium verticillioides 7600]EWG51082.1 hypothetical protein FVEG_10180 [Fusarium verticillioides 7600]
MIPFESLTMAPRISQSLRALASPKRGTRWATKYSSQPKSPSSLSSSSWPKTASIRLYEKLKRCKELQRKYEEQRDIMEESNAKGQNHSLESIELCITLTKWLRKQVQEDYDKLPLPVRRLLEFRRVTGEYASRWFGTRSEE